ncbi:MAG: hypothetical protein N2Z70_02280 [Bdellovibrionaceae bacterium]|nr:hypothetical protein [Pseudobdellovibrionaceae bacterium]
MIIPAAGWGRRVGSPAAKELWPHPRFPERSYLSIALERAAQLKLKPLVLSRNTKSELNEWLQAALPSDEFLILPETREWVDTLLGSAPYWEEKNLLFLPDTWFEPLGLSQDLVLALEQFEWAWGLHQILPESISSWGVLLQPSVVEEEYVPQEGEASPDKPREVGQLWAWEKPRELSSVSRWQTVGAWGLVAFRGSAQAYQFWRAYEKTRWNDSPALVPGRSALFQLRDFHDGTRGFK